MVTNAGENIKGGESQETASKKLDFLLDSIDTEIADLAETVVTQGPILEEALANEERLTAEYSHEPSTEVESVDMETAAAFDALNDAEDGVESILAAQEVERDPSVVETGQNSKKQDAAQALAELLTTREVDASKLLDRAMEQEEVAAEPPADDELSDDIFSDLGMESDAGEDDAPAKEVLDAEDELSEDIFSNLGVKSELKENDAGVVEGPTIDSKHNQDLSSGQDATSLTEEDFTSDFRTPSPNEKSSDALLDDKEAESPADEGGSKAAISHSATSSDNELAALISKIIESLVIRMVEERMTVIAERIITEKLNKIIATIQ